MLAFFCSSNFDLEEVCRPAPAARLRPEILDRIEFWRIRRKELRFDSAMLFQPSIDDFGSVSDKPIPNNNDMASDVLEKLIQKLYKNLGICVFPLEKPKHQAWSFPRIAHGHCANRRNLFVGPGFVTDFWCLPSKCPCPFDNWGHQDPAFVYEDDGGFLPAGFFLIRVHS